MAEPGATTQLRQAQPSPVATLMVTVSLCLACSLMVSAAVVLLRPIQLENRRLARNAQIADILERQPELRELIGDVSSAVLEEWIVHLQSGTHATEIDPVGFDPLSVAREPATSRAIPADKDIARIQRQALYGAVTVVRQEGSLRAIILPIYGRGYTSLLRGSIALASDGNTILGLIISEHGDTPGIGSEIAEQDWLRLWAGKKLRDEKGRWKFVVVNEETIPPDTDSSHRVDGISGATQSSQGVGNMVRFWLGDEGYGPLLTRIQKGELP